MTVHMIQNLKVAIAAILGYTLLSAACSAAFAYVLQGPHILDLMGQNIGRAHRLRVTQQLLIHGDGREENPEALPEVLRSVYPGKIRSDIQTENIRRIHVVSGDADLTIIDGEIVEAAPTRFDSYTEILRFQPRPVLVDRLFRYGVDTEVSSLGRFEGRIAYIVGSHYPGTGVSQLWVDQKTFRPLRWIIAGKGPDSPGEFLDIRYFEWKPVGKIWYPFRVEFHSGNRMVREIRVEDVVVDPVFDESLFDIQQVRSLYRPPLPEDGGKIGEEAISEVQKVIEDFRRKYE